jgi:predicted HD phosphohydrolase
VDKSYHTSLSSASQRSLEFQGGPFKGEELTAFENDPLKDQMVLLRLWDDRSKIPDIVDSTPRARYYLEIIENHLCEQNK